MNQAQQKAAAKAFVKRWQAAEGNEEKEARSFWIELCSEVLGIANPTHVLDFERRVRRRRIDVFFDDAKVLVEMKSADVGLDEVRHTKTYGDETPFEQARWYYDKLPRLSKPSKIITCNFRSMRIYDMDSEEYPEDNYVEIALEDLPDKVQILEFLATGSLDKVREEQALTAHNAVVIGRVYDAFASMYDLGNPEEQRCLHLLVVRLVFLLYGEDAGLFHSHLAFHDYMCRFDTSQMRGALIDLFRVLNTPKERRSKFLDESLARWEYVNGGLFAEEIDIPPFTPEIEHELLDVASAGTDWSKLSATAIGAVLESCFDADHRHQNGIHYTSPENVRKALDPLFLDDLRTELTDIKNEGNLANQRIRMRRFQDKLASIKVLDPACGGGNFLVMAYCELRRLENEVIDYLHDDDSRDMRGQIGMALTEEENPVKVSIRQFYGIEIESLAVSVAKTSMWVAEHRMMQETCEIIQVPLSVLPLKDNPNIVCADALETDWAELLPAKECWYLASNPPYMGSKNQSQGQRDQVKRVYHDSKNSGVIDYVACWYMKAAEYMGNEPIRAAFVSTNSICQGEQVAAVWSPIRDLGFHIDFAYDTFRWGNEATDQAHVFVNIIGFSKMDRPKRLFHHASPDDEPIELVASNINFYLKDAPDAFVWNRSKPLCPVPPIGIGSQPIDDGNYIFTDEERNEFLAKEPRAAKFMHPFLGSREFINGNPRNILWLGEATEQELDELPLCSERVSAVRKFRLSSKRKQTLKAAERPAHFGTEIIASKSSVIVPKVSSERRLYIPMGFIGPEVLCSDLLFLIPEATLYHYGILQSQFHNAWMRMVAGRLKSDYRYSAGVVYNTFVWPDPSDEQRERIEACAQAVLDARDAHPGKSLADLYDPDRMPADLLAAHKALDASVEAAYGVDFGGDEEKIVAHLFKLYAELTAGE